MISIIQCKASDLTSLSDIIKVYKGINNSYDNLYYTLEIEFTIFQKKKKKKKKKN